jgi:hypothetical protein
MEEQVGEQSARSLSSEWERLAFNKYLDRAENPEIHSVSCARR